MTAKPRTPVLGLAALLCGQAAAATFTVSFDPAAPALTNGWDFGQTNEQASRSATQPGGRKFAPKNAGDTLSVESPVFAADIRAVALSAWGNGINDGNASHVAVFGRANAAADYVEIFSRTGLANSLAKNEPKDTFNVPDGSVCRQLKIAYTKDKGTWILAKVTITDDAVRAAPPTNLRAETTDADARRVRVTWDMPSGVTESECRTFTTTATGGLAAVPAEGLLWRKSFADVPAAKTKVLTADAFAALGFADWEAETVRQTTVAGALLIGWEKHTSGSLVTPPLGVDVPEGSTLVLRAAKHETKTGILPVYALAGGATSCVASVTIDSTPRDYPIPLPALAAADRLLIHSATNANASNEKTLVSGLAVCAPNAYVAEGVVTNAPGDVQTLSGNAAEFVVPTDGTNLYLEVRTRLGADVSDWTPPFPVTLATSGTGGDSGGDAGDDDPTPMPDGLATPSRIRAGRLKNGALRLGWEPPAGATNVQIRIWSRTASGGLAETAADDILWRETFAAAPATNSTITLNTADKWNRYADRGADGWAWEACSAVYLASVAGALQIGKSNGAGGLVTRPLEQAGEGLMLVVTARRAVPLAGTDLHAALVTADGTTNVLAEATLTDEFEEYAWPLALASGASIVLGSPTEKEDSRMLVSDIALVRSYTPVAFATNDCVSADLGPVATLDWTPPGEHPHFVSLCAQDADGRESPWSEAVALDPAILEDWHDRHVTMTNETLDVRFRPEELPKTDKGRDLSKSPFRGLLQGEEVAEMGNRDAAKQLTVGLYVCTNVFARDWAILVPSSPKNNADIRDAELRLAIQTGGYAARRLEVSGTFAQLNATNTQEKALLVQWRQTAPDGAATDWQTLAAYTSTYTATNAAPDLAGTVTKVAGAVDFRAPRGATVEARVYCRKANDSGREAPLGFRDFRVRVCGKGPSLLFIVR